MTTRGIQERAQVTVNGQYGLMSSRVWAEKEKKKEHRTFVQMLKMTLICSCQATSCGHVNNGCALSEEKRRIVWYYSTAKPLMLGSDGCRVRLGDHSQTLLLWLCQSKWLGRLGYGPWPIIACRRSQFGDVEGDAKIWLLCSRLIVWSWGQDRLGRYPVCFTFTPENTLLHYLLPTVWFGLF